MNIQDFLTTNKSKNNRFFTIAIDGRGGSGKSVFAELLKTKLPNFVVLNGDDYFEPLDDPIVFGAFNDERLIRDIINPLKTKNGFTYRPYDWNTKQISKQKVDVTKGFCLERCYSFKFDLDWDLRIWVETPKEVCLHRGLARDGRDAAKAWHFWQQQEDEYIRNFKPEEKADIIINGTKPFEEQLERIAKL